MKNIRIATASTRTGATSVFSGAFKAASSSASASAGANIGALVLPLKP